MIELVKTWRLRPRPLELLITACLLWWAISLLWPGRGTLDSAPAFHTMRETMGEGYWGALVLLIAVPQVVSLASWYLYRDFGRSRYAVLFRRGCLLLAAAWWAFVAVQFGHDNIQNTGVGIYSLLCLSAIWMFATVDEG